MSSRHEKAAILTVEGGVLTRPTPHRQEEDLEDIIVGGEGGRVTTTQTFGNITLEDVGDFWADTGHEEEEHGEFGRWLWR